MISNLYTDSTQTNTPYHLSDSSQPFEKYISQCEALIKERRQDLQPPHAEKIITANTPYELFPNIAPQNGTRFKKGVLLIHGLLDSPFTLRDVGTHLQQQGIYSRSILLPGHGTHPNDLMHITFHDWIQAVRAAVESLRKEVEQVYLLGYSTGAALSVLQAAQDPSIAGIVLLSPAIRIKTELNFLLKSRTMLKWLNKPWLCYGEEIDYTKYSSVTVNAVKQVADLTDVIADLQQVSCPIFMSLSREDEAISSRHAIDFFTSTQHANSELLLYSSSREAFADKRIEHRFARDFQAQIRHFSHVSIPIAPNNPHYGQDGDYVNATNCHAENILYGAYNRVIADTFDFLHRFGAVKTKRKELTFNPDFDYMAKRITAFVTTHPSQFHPTSK